MKKSFVFGVAVSDYNFTGRSDETLRLKRSFEEGVNTILISPRRWGKTSLVKHVCRQINNSKVLTIYMDMFACKDEYDFYNQLAAAVLKQTANQKDLWMENAREFLSRLTPKISISPEPNSDFSLSLGITARTHSPEEVLELAEEIAKKRQIRIVICIDEFQQIGEFQDSVTVQKRLRSVWQHQQLTSYCLFGSKKHLMSNIFQKRNMPFYQFGDLMFLKKIPTEEWVEYITSHFAERNRNISKKLAEDICAAVDNFSSYVQQLSLLVLMQTEEGDTVTDAHLTQAISDLLDSNELLFMQQIEPLTAYQMNFLMAIGSGIHFGFNEQAVRDNFDFGSTSNIERLRTALTERDLIESNGKELFITDPIFRLWLMKKR